MMTLTVTAQKKKEGVFTNLFRDNWEVSAGIQGVAFYSGKEDNSMSKSPFNSNRTSIGLALAATKWFTPEIAVRLKGTGYWGKTFTEEGSKEIHMYGLHALGVTNILNIIKGYNPNRRWNAGLYGGLSALYNQKASEMSFAATAGITGAYAVSDQLKIYADMGLTFGGQKKSETGSFHTIAAEMGVTVTLGKSKWNKKATHTRGILQATPVGSIEDADLEGRNAREEKIIVNNDVPEGMVVINRGHLKMGVTREDSLWGWQTPVRDISVDDFLMDKTEVTNRQYRAFIQDVCDSIVAERMKDPYYEGDRNKVMESLYITNPITTEKMLDARQLIYVYEEYDYTAANMRKYRIDPEERVLNTDHRNDSNDVIISKDTAYIDKQGNIIKETIERPLTGSYDFLNTYIVNIYPDTTCWINDFPNAENEIYTAYYFSNPAYLDYPVVGISWEQANAYCAWRTEREGLKGKDRYLRKYRLPTEAEWEYAARGVNQNEFPWEKEREGESHSMFFANFMPADGNFTKDGNIITARVGTYPPNSNGLYDMAGNVAEWTSTHYTTAGIQAMNNINPQLKYNAAMEDPYRMKRKCVRGGSWKDSERHIQSAWRTAEYQNQPRSYIGFRCVQSMAVKPTEKTVVVINNKKKRR